MPFAAVCQKMIDAWVGLQPGDHGTPQDIYADVADKLTTRMRLSLVDVSDDDPEQWELKTIRHSRLPARILDLNVMFRGGRLADFPDKAYLQHAVIPKYLHVMEKRQPLIDSVETRLAGVRVVYDRIILPQKGVTRPDWLVVCTFGRFMARLPNHKLEVNAADEAVLMRLMEGLSAKEIALEVGLSPRTVEHRLERLKKQLGARSLPHLAAMLVALGFDGSISYRDEID